MGKISKIIPFFNNQYNYVIFHHLFRLVSAVSIRQLPPGGDIVAIHLCRLSTTSPSSSSYLIGVTESC